MSQPEDAGWGWMTTSYTNIPQIQRCDETRPNWTDDQAAAFVLNEMAHGNREYFAQALQMHTLSQIWHWIQQEAEDWRQEPVLPYAEDIVRRYDYIKLPEHPPEWLQGLI